MRAMRKFAFSAKTAIEWGERGEKREERRCASSRTTVSHLCAVRVSFEEREREREKGGAENENRESV